MGKWRAMVLIGVHLAIAIHVIHWKMTGSTVTPVEPSEAMQTLELGYVNAGFIFLALSILSTMIFGRWMCGWACHLVAMQDLCSWILKKIGIRPKPLRTRLLVWIPVFAAFYMFVYPSLIRILAGHGNPAWAAHFQTENFWATFPNWQIATLTIATCGFLIVVLLGNKGFCTYGCPYGGIFYHADRVAPGRIRVTDDCDQCGHCTTACTSNIRVHEQVAVFKMVHDSGCMKCMDCVSVCPKGALYYGFGSPIPVKTSIARPERHYDVSMPEEIALFAFFAGSFYAFRGLYEAVPFLLSVGLSSMNAFLVLSLCRLFYKRELRVQRWQLKRLGKLTRTGWVGACIGFVLAALTVHSGIVNYYTHEGNRALLIATALSEKDPNSSEATILAKLAELNFTRADSMGIFPVAEWKYKLGVAAQFRGDFETAKNQFRNALELDSNRPNTRLQLAHLSYLDHDFDTAQKEFKLALEAQTDLGILWSDYAESLLRLGKNKEALDAFNFAVLADPDRLSNLLNQGMLLAQSGELESGSKAIESYVSKNPTDFVGHLNLGLVKATIGKTDEALASLDQAIRLKGDSGAAWIAKAQLLASNGQPEKAYRHALTAIGLDPHNLSVVSDFLSVVVGSKMEGKAISELHERKKLNPKLNYGLAGLYAAIGNRAKSGQILQEIWKTFPNLPGF
jgi:polyferredoxin/Tfp pilus assembly protein PilF